MDKFEAPLVMWLGIIMLFIAGCCGCGFLCRRYARNGWNFISASVITCWGAIARAITRAYDFISYNVIRAWGGITVLFELLFELLRTLVIRAWGGITVLFELLFELLRTLDRTKKISIVGAMFASILGSAGIFVPSRFGKAAIVFALSLSLLLQFVGTYLVKMREANAWFEWIGVYFRVRLGDGQRVRFSSVRDYLQLLLLSVNLSVSIVHLIVSFRHRHAEAPSRAPPGPSGPSSSWFDIPANFSCCFITFLVALREAMKTNTYTRLKPNGTRRALERIKNKPYQIDEHLLSYPNEGEHAA